MTSRSLTATLVLAAGFALAGATAQAGETSGVGSSAYGVAAGFISDGTATTLAPMPFAGGGEGGRHHGWAHNSSLDETLYIGANGLPIATLQVTATKAHAHADSDWFGIDHAAPSADGSIDTLTITLQAYPAPATSTPPLLSIVATGVTFQATDSVTVPKAPVVSGSGESATLKITGSLVNGDTINQTGPAAANDAITIPLPTGGYTRVTLNRQITHGAIACTSTCTFTPTGIVVDALEVHLDQVTISGHPVGGEITVGQAAAHIGG
jgi:hypothetical protein